MLSQRTMPRGLDCAQRDLSVIIGRFLSASLKSGMDIAFELKVRLKSKVTSQTRSGSQHDVTVDALGWVDYRKALLRADDYALLERGDVVRILGY